MATRQDTLGRRAQAISHESRLFGVLLLLLLLPQGTARHEREYVYPQVVGQVRQQIVLAHAVDGRASWCHARGVGRVICVVIGIRGVCGADTGLHGALLQRDRLPFALVAALRLQVVAPGTLIDSEHGLDAQLANKAGKVVGSVAPEPGHHHVPPKPLDNVV